MYIAKFVSPFLELSYNAFSIGEMTPKNCLFSQGDPDPYLTRRPTRVFIPNHNQPFFCSSPESLPILYMSPKIAPSPTGIRALT